MIQTSGDRRIQHLFPLALACVLVLGTSRLILDNLKSNQTNFFGQHKRHKTVFVLPEDRIEEGCNVFEGKWVWDNVSLPYYTEQTCPYLVKQTTCLKNGRPDSFYQNWRWNPNQCNLPRYVFPFLLPFFLSTLESF